MTSDDQHHAGARSPVDELATQAEDLALLDAMAAHYDQLTRDARAWEQYRADVTTWDATAGDGLAVPT